MFNEENSEEEELEDHFSQLGKNRTNGRHYYKQRRETHQKETSLP